MMRAGFYPHLAISAIGKNKRFYLPYILTCTGMIMMNYIIAFLTFFRQPQRYERRGSDKDDA